MTQRIESKLKALPQEPGVYLYRSGQGKIIYVGKAANLRHRVRSYWQKRSVIDWKTPILVNEIADLEWITTASEIDALFLESELIKRYQPKYNVDLKDEKSYLFVRINLKADYPAVELVRQPLDDGATYFGPFIDAGGLRRALRYLRHIFPYSTHTTIPKRACLDYHLGLCPGLEEGKITIAEYRQNLRRLMQFLKGERVKLIKQLEGEMKLAATSQDYELAATRRNQARSLRALAKQIMFGDTERHDLTTDQALNGLAQLLDLPKAPRRIEAYDISHIAGSDNVASMIVFLDGSAAKSQYRKFKMHLTGNDDFAHMREVIGRRFGDKQGTKWPKPDLLLIDGGSGQLAAAKEALALRQVNVPAIGLAKREEKIIHETVDPRLQTTSMEMIKLDRDSEVLKLLQRIRDESHRFAVAYHSLLRSKRQTASRIEAIPGVGPATRKKLIRYFGSLRAVQSASAADLTKVVGKHKAQRLLSAL